MLIVVHRGMMAYCIKVLLKSVTGEAMFTQYFGVHASAYFLALSIIVVISWGLVHFARLKVVTYSTC
jgi:hypothetical protein